MEKIETKPEQETKPELEENHETEQPGTPSQKLYKALQNERQQRKDLEARIKTLEAEKAVLEPFKAQWEALERDQEIARIIEGMTRDSGKGLRIDKDGNTYQPERFKEVFKLMEADKETPLEDKVKKAFVLSSVSIRELMKTSSPHKGADSLESQGTSKYFAKAPSHFLNPSARK